MNWAEFVTIAIAHLFAVASPGPDFAVVVRQTVHSGTLAGLWTSLGVGLGILLHVTYCILGVGLLLSRSAPLFNAMKWIAAAYLLYLGLRSLRAALSPNQAELQGVETSYRGHRRAVLVGFLTNGLNPKATLFFLALFTLVISPQTPVMMQLVYGTYLSAATFAWFAMLSLMVGKRPVRGFLQRAGNWFEAGMGVILVLLALQLARTGFNPS